MAKRSKTSFKANTASQFPTNGTGLIGANRVRTHIGEDVPDSFVNVVDDLQLFATATGTNTYALAGSITSYASGFMAIVKFTNAASSGCSLNINGIGAKNIYVNPTTQANSGNIIANQIYLLIYDATLNAAAGGFLIIGSIVGTSDSLTRVTFDVDDSSGIATQDLGSAVDRVFVGNTSVASDIELVFDNTANFIRATTFLTVSGTRNITVPASVTTDLSKWAWSKPATQLIWAADAGSYRLQWAYDGTNIHLDIYGLYATL